MEISSQEEFFKPTMNRELVNLDFSEINIQPTQPKAKKQIISPVITSSSNINQLEIIAKP